MQCPNDSCEIEVKEAEFHIGLTCEKCKGIWLPKRYIDTLCRNYSVDAEELWAVLKKAVSLNSELACPECKEGLRTIEYSKIQLHCCDHCDGLWFHAGQLTAMEKALLKDDRLQHKQQHWFNDAVLGVFKDLVKTRTTKTG